MPLWRAFRVDEDFVSDLQSVNATDRPLDNPWGFVLDTSALIEFKRALVLTAELNRATAAVKLRWGKPTDAIDGEPSQVECAE